MIRLLFFTALFFLPPNSYSQSNAKNASLNYKPEMQRLLIKLLGTNLYNIFQWQIDYDSSIVLACQVEGLSHSLFVNESFDDGSPLPGKELIERKNIPSAIQLLANLHGADRIKLLLQLGGYFLFKPRSDKEDMSYARHYLTEALTLSDYLGILNWKNGSRSMLGKYYYQVGDFLKSKSYFSEVVNACNISGDETGLARALADRGNYALYNDTGKLSDMNRALDLFRRQNDKVGQIDILARISELHFIQGLWVDCKKEWIESVDLAKEIGFRHIHIYYDALAYMEQVKGNTINAIYYADQAIRTMEEINDQALSSHFYFRKGNIYGGVGIVDRERSNYWYRKAIESAGETGTNRLWYTSFVWLSRNLAWSKRYKEALELIDSVTAKFPPLNPLDKIYLAQAKAFSYFGLNQESLAEKNFAEIDFIADQLSSQPQMYNDIWSVYDDVAEMYISAGNIKKAKECLHKI
ncbi:MAG TPA: hypothetical protein VFI33_07180, partial [Puia sp.]|nr:hypothetical protein [Puia sp.]